MPKLNYRVGLQGPFYTLTCEWGPVPSLYSSKKNAELMRDLFHQYPEYFWPIRYHAGMRELDSYTFSERESLIHGEWVLFLPSHCKVFWSFRIPGYFPKTNIFPTAQDAFDYAAQRGKFHVIKLPRHRSRFNSR